MNIVVVGCGKVGSSLARKLQRDGHDVAVVDEVEERFERLGDSFDGITVAGVPFDEEVLKAAGIEGCDALAAVTQDDNINIMVGQVARELFSVPTVITRIYDPARKDVFAHFGLHTVCPTNLTVDAITQSLTTGSARQYATFGSTTLSYVYLPVEPGQVGRQTDCLSLEAGLQLLGVLHGDTTMELCCRNPIALRPGDTLIAVKIVD